MAFHRDAYLNLDFPALAEKFETSSVEEILTWTWEVFGTQASIGTSFQGSGLVIMHHAWKKLGIPLPAFTIDTGLLFSETLQTKARLEEYFGVEIESLHPEQSVEEQEKTLGPELWKRAPDTCCTLRKVLPLQVKLNKLDVWITGMRRADNDFRKERKYLERYQFDSLMDLFIFKLNPMLSWSRKEVWEYIEKYKIPYNPLHDQGFKSIGCWPCTRATDNGENSRAGRWEGFDKTECGIHTFLGASI